MTLRVISHQRQNYEKLFYNMSRDGYLDQSEVLEKLFQQILPKYAYNQTGFDLDGLFDEYDDITQQHFTNQYSTPENKMMYDILEEVIIPYTQTEKVEEEKISNENINSNIDGEITVENEHMNLF